MYKYQREKNNLKKILGESMYKDLKKHKMIVAGGFITSLFTRTEFNDIDIYGTDNTKTLEFAEKYLQKHGIMYHTKKATMFSCDEKPYQIIHYKDFKDSYDIFNSFDFTICSGAYDFQKEEFILHEDFIKHLASRELFFNEGTDFPLMSALRLSKYKEKGFSILKSEFVRVIMACMNLEINSYEELKDQLGGMYNYNVDKLFEDLEDKEFSLDKAMEKLQYMYLEDRDFQELQKEELFDYELEKVLDEIDKSERIYTKIDDKVFRIYGGGKLKRIFRFDKEKAKEEEFVPLTDALKDISFYKFVSKKDGLLTSNFDNDFEYKLNTMVTYKSDSHPYLYFNFKDKLDNSTYYDKDGTVIEAFVNPDDISDIDDGTVMVKKAYVSRIVPQEEWHKWVLEGSSL